MELRTQFLVRKEGRVCIESHRSHQVLFREETGEPRQTLYVPKSSLQSGHLITSFPLLERWWSAQIFMHLT